ncbi:hypothetical protein CA54_06170 [Symmachiella macrocystis]|uniref:DUF1501 domain-containing protein n=1 Tax=Symmachiella macrocystis TaxID=2527985 RepID=A0A5C6BKC8_9PLAN|nr:DUF1501 domain-containing protein [Symmachiella macrocystis]TWU11806.1 hypothetical protein CA54_06170 [Symmachiella macrocystis]
MPRSTPHTLRPSRRDVLCAGTLAIGGINLSHLLRAEEAVSGSSEKSAIVILLDGGPSHIDTFDPKPTAPREMRGEFSTISTSLPGVQFCEHLPQLAQATDRYALVRGVSHSLSDHGLGKKYILTGTPPLASIQYPSYSAVMNYRNPAAIELPGTVAIPRSPQGPGFLGIEHASFETGEFPKAGRPLDIPALALPTGTTSPMLERRERLRRTLDQKLEQSGNSTVLLDGMDRHSQKAYSILTSRRTRAAFDLSQEKPAFAKQFAQDAFSQSCLLAIRLVEAGVRCVTISFGGWDTHRNNFPTLKNKNLPRLDTGLVALLQGLTQRGLFDSTSVLATGEFGRTPKINAYGQPGREHYAKCMFMLLAGGGFVGGQVVGGSDTTGSLPAEVSISPDDVAATFYTSLGMDPEQVLHSPDGRPVTLVRNGSPIRQLIRGS